MVRYRKFLEGTLPNARGAIEIVPGISDTEYSLEGVKNRISEVITNLPKISKAVRVITIRDKYGDSVSIFRAESHVHARYTTDAIGGLGSDPDRVSLLTANFNSYIFSYDHLKENDVQITLNMQLRKTAAKIVFQYRSCDDENGLGSYKNDKSMQNYEFRKINMPM